MEQIFQEEKKNSLEKNLDQVQLISYFKNATRESPIFLSDIQRKYHEIKPLLEMGLIQSQKPERSYVFNLDKLENYFYAKYQEKIDNLRFKIKKAKIQKKVLMQKVQEMEPEKDCPDYEQKLLKCLMFARKAAQETEIIEKERKEVIDIIKAMYEAMRQDPFFELLFHVRNDRDIIYNKRIIDKNNEIKKKIISHANACCKDENALLYADIKKMGIFKSYSPAQSYYITEMGKVIDNQLKEFAWNKGEDLFVKNAAELAQEEEFEQIRKEFGF